MQITELMLALPFFLGRKLILEKSLDLIEKSHVNTYYSRSEGLYHMYLILMYLKLIWHNVINAGDMSLSPCSKSTL